MKFYLLSFTPATYDINRRLPPCRQLSGRPRRPRPGSPASLEEVNWSLFVCRLVILLILIFYITMRVAIIIVKIRTIVNPVMRDTVAVASGKIYKRGKDQV